MAPSIAVLLAFTALTFALVAVYVNYRVALVLTGKTAANSWTRGAATWTNPAWTTRFEHAHLNCLENLPVYAAVVLAASLLGQLNLIDGLAWTYFGFRIAQSLVHVINTGPVFVFIRALMLTGQWVILAYWLLKLSGLI